MKRWMVGLTLAAMVLVTQEAMAKRMGGGLSIGRSSGNVTQRYASPSPAAPTQNASQQRATPSNNAATAPKRSPWGGILGGLAAGLGLAWLANSLGLGAGFANILLIALLAIAGFWLLRRLLGGAQQPAYAGADMPSYNSKNVGNDASARPWEGAHAAFDATPSAPSTPPASGSMIGAALGHSSANPLMGSQTWGVPSGFDSEGFLRACKSNFVRLQAAWDAADTESLKTLMTDDLLHDITQQLRERQAHSNGAPNITEVVELNAQLLGVEELSDEYLASVEFHGLIKEDPQQAAAPFREVWNIVKSKHRGGWLVAGVQALG